MPLYEYECRKDGVFELTRPISEASRPARCPACRRSAARILSLPNVALLSRSEVIARDRNEKSRHEPRIVTASDGPLPGRKRPRRLQSQHHGRPWALEHG
jgi:putative FmdB family regulatory protein